MMQAQGDLMLTPRLNKGVTLLMRSRLLSAAPLSSGFSLTTDVDPIPCCKIRKGCLFVNMALLRLGFLRGLAARDSGNRPRISLYFTLYSVPLFFLDQAFL